MAGELSDVTMARRRSLVRDRSFASTTPSTTPARRLPVGLRAVGLIAERSAPAAVEEHAIRSVPYGPAPVGWPGDTHLHVLVPRNVANRQDACLSAQPLAAFATGHSTGNNAAVACSRTKECMAVGFLGPVPPVAKRAIRGR